MDTIERSERKASQRRIARDARKALSPAYRESASERIRELVTSSAAFGSAVTVASYEWMNSEVQTALLNADAISAGKTVIVPEVLGPESMRFVRLRDTDPTESVDLAEADLILVPAVGFDLAGGRLGNGRGYYDRALAGVSGLKVCIVFEAQRIDDLEVGANDVGMDVIVTESGVVFGADRWSL